MVNGLNASNCLLYAPKTILYKALEYRLSYCGKVSGHSEIIVALDIIERLIDIMNLIIISLLTKLLLNRINNAVVRFVGRAM